MSTGYYGKLPGTGDFVTRQLPQQFIQSWDRWLQDGQSTSQEYFGDQWLNLFLTSPIWRFALSPSLCSESAWLGLIMPSVDSVGRYFPLTIAVEVGQPSNIFTLAQGATEWFDASEEVLLSALDARFSIQHFDSAIQKLNEIAIPNQLLAPQKRTLSKATHWHSPLAQSAQPESGFGSMLNNLALSQMPPFSLWWSEGSELIQPTMLLCPDLPQPARCPAFLNGEWSEHGWNGV